MDALNAIPLYTKKYKINSIIFIVDGEHIKQDPSVEIRKHLESKGIGINEFIPLQGAFCIKCESGPYKLTLFCIILGPEVFIEEEVAKLIKVKMGVEIDLSRKRDSKGRKMVKGKIKQILRERDTSIEDLVRNTGKDALEKIFPNICTVLKKIEEEQ